MRSVGTALTSILVIALLAGCTVVVAPNIQTEPSNQGIEPQAGQWETWVLASGDELRPPPPPDSAATTAEIAELKALAAQRDAAVEEMVAYWDAGAPGYRWNSMALDALSPGPPSARVSRVMALLNVAIYDATVAAWDAKYTYNRPYPSRQDAALTTLIAAPDIPSYPSEHAAAAGAAATVLGYLFPDDAGFYAAKAEEAAHSRLLAGVNYPSDIEAGLALGHAVGEKVVAWAKEDGSDVQWTGQVPTGPGLWQGENPAGVTVGSWRTWVLAAGDQVRPPAPPAFDSEQIQAELTEIKTITRTLPIVQKTMYWGSFEGAYPYWYNRLNLHMFERDLDRNPPHAARMYMTMSVANYDAGVACQDAKYAYWFIRPPQLDPEVTTLIPTPNHPSYPAGASCSRASMGTVLGALFPAEAEAIMQKVAESDESRIWAGIHYRIDVETGNKMGRDVAQMVLERVHDMTQP